MAVKRWYSRAVAGMDLIMSRNSCLALILLALTASRGWAQPSLIPSNRPRFSPWLNLNRFGNDPTLNYYGLVRPQFATIGALQNLQQEANNLQQQQQQLETTGSALPATGHVAGFLNHSKYFLNRGGVTPQGGRGASISAPGQGAAAASPQMMPRSRR